MIKEQLVKQYQILLQDKIDLYQDMINSLTEDAQNDAKSSAGDKHETTLSKLHIEQEKIAHKLKEAIESKDTLSKIDIQKLSDRVVLGSLVKTNHLTAFVGISMSKLVVDHQNIFGITTQSPLGQQLLGKSVGDKFLVNGVNYEVLEVF
jgi:transcription elongation GreA/GreB family factor